MGFIYSLYPTSYQGHFLSGIRCGAREIYRYKSSFWSNLVGKHGPLNVAISTDFYEIGMHLRIFISKTICSVEPPFSFSRFNSNAEGCIYGCLDVYEVLNIFSFSGSLTSLLM